MAKGLIGKKLGMTHLFDAETGRISPVTVIEAGPCVVVQLKKQETDGYNKVQLGFIEQKASRVSKPLQGHFAKAECSPMRILKEFDLSDGTEFQLGDQITLSIFENVKKVDVSGMTKGKGFQGVIKRYKGHRGRKTHGGKSYRVPGSVGQCSTGKIFKGKHMPGQMGNVRCTIQSLEIMRMDIEKNLLFVKGAVPGHNNGILLIKEAVKA